MARLLLEIVCEELPPGAVASALEQLGSAAEAAFAEARLGVKSVKTLGTVRRIAVLAEGVSPRQADRVSTVRGPAARVAYDAAGAPTQAAIGFARAQGVSVDSLQIREMDGGRYVAAEVRELGRPAIKVLEGVLPALIASVSFPKTMRWEAHGVRFGRPIRRIVALLGRRVVPFSYAGVRSGRRSAGHRFLGTGLATLPDADSYEAVMDQQGVVLDPARRRGRIVEGATSLAFGIGGSPILDQALLEELVWSIEHPTPLAGSFDPALAEALPSEVVVVTLQHHQKYFAVAGGSGALLPAFVAVRDGGVEHLDSVRTGHEWVVRARLADAQFFLDEDRRGGFDAWCEDLGRVAQISGLGSVSDHVLRVVGCAGWLAAALTVGAAERSNLARAARLCKADLVTAMVREFPELQGTMGRIYALERGERPAVAAAIEEHYWPKGSGGRLPATLPGALLAVADRAVLIAGSILAGLEPSGSQDPYGLRRAAAGVVSVLEEHNLGVSVDALFSRAASEFGVPESRAAEAARRAAELVRQRLRAILIDRGYAYDTVAAVMAVGSGDVPDIVRRAGALHDFRSRPEMARLMTAYQRAVRIVAQSGAVVPAAEESRDAGAAVREDLIAEPAEQALYDAWRSADSVVRGAVARRDYAAALSLLAGLDAPVAAFFDTVLVMAPDPLVRQNRLALLRSFAGSFGGIADFGVVTSPS